MTTADHDEKVVDLLQCTRCCQRFLLPAEWQLDDVPDKGGGSDSFVSCGSLTDSSVGTASECDTIFLPELEAEGSFPPSAVSVALTEKGRAFLLRPRVNIRQKTNGDFSTERSLREEMLDADRVYCREVADSADWTQTHGGQVDRLVALSRDRL